ncbi:hypothetical protein D9M68_500300 [compost metagenome]
MNGRAATCFKRLAKGDGLLDIPAVLRPVGRRDPHRHRPVRRKCRANGLEDFKREAHAVFQRSTIVVCATVGEGRQELMQEIAVGSVNLDSVQPESGGAPGGIGEGRADLRKAGAIERHRMVIVIVERDRARCDGFPAAFVLRVDLATAFPWDFAGSFPSGMTKLDGDGHVGPPSHPVQNPAHRALAGIRIKPDIAIGNTALRQDCGRLDGENSRTRQGQITEMDKMPVGHLPVRGRILAHWRDDDAVSQIKRSHFQGRKKPGSAHDRSPEVDRACRVGPANVSPFSSEVAISRCRRGFRTCRSGSAISIGLVLDAERLSARAQLSDLIRTCWAAAKSLRFSPFGM